MSEHAMPLKCVGKPDAYHKKGGSRGKINHNNRGYRCGSNREYYMARLRSDKAYGVRTTFFQIWRIYADDNFDNVRLDQLSGFPDDSAKFRYIRMVS